MNVKYFTVLSITIVFLILSSGCITPTYTSCGDGVCDADKEKYNTCPKDCSETTNITLEGKNVTILDFPESFFVDGNIEPERMAYILDLYYDIIANAFGKTDALHRIYIKYSNENCGSYSNSHDFTVTICKSFTPNGRHNWAVYAHEISHNIAGQSPLFLYLAEHGYSAYLDEHQAEIMPEYVFWNIKNNQTAYGITNSELEQMRLSNEENRRIQQNSYSEYVANGKQFYILQDDVEKATKTGHATSHIIFKLVDNDQSPQRIKFFVRALNDDWLKQAGFDKKTPTDEELANYVIAAHSAAKDGDDLRSTFRDELNYPVNDTLYQKYYQLLAIK